MIIFIFNEMVYQNQSEGTVTLYQTSRYCFYSLLILNQAFICRYCPEFNFIGVYLICKQLVLELSLIDMYN